RSQPYSRYHPQFSRDALQRSLEESGIRYVFMGDLLGGRPSDPGCYDKEGKIDYERVKTMDFFKAGIERIKTAYAKNLPIALMCSERDPGHCHRSKLIGPVLVEEKIHLLHIDEKDHLRNQAEVMARSPKKGD
ncbi:MAG TPA: DUF488 domain-containing protein, partial [Puia sp.]|nr:DUF488 domain-containing protein [Puia sp.]